MTVQEIGDAEFGTDVVHASLERPIIVDFWAAWCGPCKQIAPVLDEISDAYPGVTVLKMETDMNPTTTTRYEVTSVPTIIVFQDGEPVRSIMGARPKTALIRELSEWLK
jgi:thioredoxin 1